MEEAGVEAREKARQRIQEQAQGEKAGGAGFGDIQLCQALFYCIYLYPNYIKHSPWRYQDFPTYIQIQLTRYNYQNVRPATPPSSSSCGELWPLAEVDGHLGG